MQVVALSMPAFLQRAEVVLSEQVQPSAANYKQVIARHGELSDDVRAWLDVVPELVEHYTWDVSIAFVFMRIEAINHEVLYRGLVRRHLTDAPLTRALLDRDHMTRRRFRELVKTVFDAPIPADVDAHLTRAEVVRNRVIHGKQVTDAQARACLMAAFEFIEGLNNFIFSTAGFRPCADGRGFKGRVQSLSKDTSRWVLRGMGIPASGKEAASES